MTTQTLEMTSSAENKNAFPFTLPKTMCNSIFLKKKTREYAKIGKVLGFIKGNKGISYIGNERYEFLPFDNEMEQINEYKNKYNKDKKFFETTYKLPTHKWGRITPVGSLSMCIFHRPTRHTFAKGVYVDIDMCNAMPTYIDIICKQNGIPSDNIGKYSTSYKEYRDLIMDFHNCSKDVAKRLPITILNGGSYASWLKKNKIEKNKDVLIAEFVGIETEMKSIISIVYANNKDIEKDVLKSDPNKWKSEFEKKCGVMALWSQTIEKYIQETAILWLVENKNFVLDEIIPCQDGFMILEKLYYDDILDDINSVVDKNCNLAVKFAKKAFDEDFEIEDMTENSHTFDEWEDLLSPKMLAETFMKYFSKYVLKYKHNIYVFYENRWYDETSSKCRYKLGRYISENLHNIIENDIKEDISLSEKEKSSLLKTLRKQTNKEANTKDIIFHILSVANEREIDFNNNPFLLGFNNGVYDLQNDEFREYRYDDYVSLTTKYDYSVPDYEDPETKKMGETIADLIRSIQPDDDMADLYVQCLASGLDGIAYQKLFLFTGMGGNGKGLTGALMEKILGSYYYQPGNGILKDIEKANVPSPDMINLKNKRYINFKEVSGTLRAAVLRNLTGGGKFVGRYLNQNPEDFFMNATFVMEFNTDPDLDGKPQQADYRRMVYTKFPVNFTDDVNKIGKEIGGVIYKEANTYYTTQDFLEKAKLVLLDYLLNVYRTYKQPDGTGIKFNIPESVKQRTQEYIENQNIFQRLFNNNWQKCEIKLNSDGTPDKNDEEKKTLAVKDIWEIIETQEEYKRLSYREKRQYNKKEFYTWIEGFCNVTGDNKKGKIIIGLEPADIDLDKSDTYEEIDNCDTKTLVI
jgi:phage/plasmid-associated DNA primase